MSENNKPDGRGSAASENNQGDSDGDYEDTPSSGRPAAARSGRARAAASQSEAGVSENKPSDKVRKNTLDEMTIGRTEVPYGHNKPSKPRSSGGKPGTRTTRGKG